jgi:hypothetical protein
MLSGASGMEPCLSEEAVALESFRAAGCEPKVRATFIGPAVLLAHFPLRFALSVQVMSHEWRAPPPTVRHHSPGRGIVLLEKQLEINLIRFQR